MSVILLLNLSFRFDFDKFISAIQDVKQGVNERLRQWAEYEALLEKLINWLGDSEVWSRTCNVCLGFHCNLSSGCSEKLRS